MFTGLNQERFGIPSIIIYLLLGKQTPLLTNQPMEKVHLWNQQDSDF